MQKQTLLLIPGTACDERVWQHQQHHLSNLVNIMIADLTGANTIDAIISQALYTTPQTFLLAGHSLGGWVCLEIIKRYPERVKKLCLLATNAELDTENTLDKRKERIRLAQNNQFDSVAAELTEAFTYQEKIKPAVFAMFKDNRKLFISQQQAVIMRKCNLSLLPLITKPTLIMVGRQDKIFFESTKTLARNIANAQFIIIENCGHMLTMEMPEIITALMSSWIKGDVVDPSLNSKLDRC